MWIIRARELKVSRDPTRRWCGNSLRAGSSRLIPAYRECLDFVAIFNEGLCLAALKRPSAGRRSSAGCSSFSKGGSTALYGYPAKYRVSGYFQREWKSVSVSFSIVSVTLRLHTPPSEEAHAREHNVFLFTDLNGRSTKDREDHQFGALRCRTLREVELEATEKRQPDNLLLAQFLPTLPRSNFSVAFLELAKYPFTPRADANAITIGKQNISNQRFEGYLSAEQFGHFRLEP